MNTNLKGLFGGNTPRSIQAKTIPGTLRVSFLAAHPDDFDAVGITMRYFRDNGNAIDLGVVRTGAGVEDSYGSALTAADKSRIREEEQRMSCRFFGLPKENLHFLDLENDDEDQPMDVPVNTDYLRKFLQARQADIVFLLHGNDTNSGHRTMYSMFRHIALQADKPLVALMNRDCKTMAMRMDLHTSFDKEDAQWKGELLRFHASQHQRNLNTRGHGFDDRVLNENRRIAEELSLDEEFAEVFEVEFYGLKEDGITAEP